MPADEGTSEIEERLMDVVASFVAHVKAPEAIQPRQSSLDGLLAKDKFRMTRHARLSLSHSRRRPNLLHRQTERAADARTYPPAGTTRHGGNDETSVALTQGSGGTTG